jgi:hypothetical protein
MTDAQRNVLTSFLRSLADLPWFAHCGEPHANAIVAPDLVEAWDGWGSEMMAVWSPETHSLERIAVGELEESGVDAIFDTVSRTLGAALLAGIEQYFERRPTNTEAAEINADRGLWPEWLETAKRDLCWAAVEAVLGRPGFFTELLGYYRTGRWPCAWENSDRNGRVVLL